MKTTLAILATSVVTAITLYFAKKRRDRGTGVLQGTFQRVREATHHG